MESRNDSHSAVKALAKGQAALTTNVAALTTDVAALTTNVAALTTDVAALTTDVAALKEGQAALTADVAALNKGQEVLTSDMSDVKSTNRRIIATLVRLEGKVDDVVERMATKDDLRLQNQRLDAGSGQLEDMRFRHAVHADTLQRHEERIARLEKRES